MRWLLLKLRYLKWVPVIANHLSQNWMKKVQLLIKMKLGKHRIKLQHLTICWNKLWTRYGRIMRNWVRLSSYARVIIFNECKLLHLMMGMMQYWSGFQWFVHEIFISTGYYFMRKPRISQSCSSRVILYAVAVSFTDLNTS